MDTAKQMHIKNRTYYFYNDIIDLEKNYDCMNINSINPLYLGITRANGYIEDKGMDKYLIFDSAYKNKELLKKYNDVFNGIRNKIKEMNNECDYEKDYLKI